MDHPVYAAIQTASSLPGFRFTSFVELVSDLLKSAIDTPEERESVKRAIMLAYDAFVAPRVKLPLFRTLAENAVDRLLESLGG